MKSALPTRLAALGFERVTTPPVALEVTRLNGGTVAVVGSRPALGTRVSVVAHASAGGQAADAIHAAFLELDRLAASLSRHDPASALSVLNDAGELAGPPPELRQVVERACFLHTLTGGAFDVTVKPVLDLFASADPTSLSRAEVRDAAALVGTGHVRTEASRIRFDRSGMGMTLDGIAKGYIVDRMIETLRGHGIRHSLVDAGGDVRAHGGKADGQPWIIGVRDPVGGDLLQDSVALRDGAVATSGGYERFYGADRRFHHIVSPATGRSPLALLSATVVARTALAADALATGIFVLGRVHGLRLIEQLRACQGLVIDARGAPQPSAGWSALVAHQLGGKTS